MRDIRAENNKHNQPQPPPHHHHHNNNNKIVRGWMRKVCSMKQGGKKNRMAGVGGGGGGGEGYWCYISSDCLQSTSPPLFRPEAVFIPSFLLSFRCHHCQYLRSPHTPVSSGATIANIFHYDHCQYLPVPQLPVSSVSSGASIASIFRCQYRQYLEYMAAVQLRIAIMIYVLPVCVDFTLFLVFVDRFYRTCFSSRMLHYLFHAVCEVQCSW